MHCATFDLGNGNLHTVLSDWQGSWLWTILIGTEAKSAILAVTPRVHLIVTSQDKNMTFATSNLHNFGAEARKANYGRSTDDLNFRLFLNRYI